MMPLFLAFHAQCMVSRLASIWEPNKSDILVTMNARIDLYCKLGDGGGGCQSEQEGELGG